MNIFERLKVKNDELKLKRSLQKMGNAEFYWLFDIVLAENVRRKKAGKMK